MDLTIKMEDTYLNIRVVVILETENGFVLQKHKRGNYFFIGMFSMQIHNIFTPLRTVVDAFVGL